MPISREVRIVIQCDECPNNYIEVFNQQATIISARKYGWYINRDRRARQVLCPSCYKLIFNPQGV